MNKDEIEIYIINNFKDINVIDSWGEKSFFLNPGQKLKRGTYWATVKEKDGDNDKASYLNRNEVFRLNIGITKDCYLSLFSKIPKRPAKGGVIAGDYNFQKLDTIMPHPISGWMAWVCVLNPRVPTFEDCKFLLDNAYDKALKTTIRKLQKQHSP